jgi:hypothetical protein
LGASSILFGVVDQVFQLSKVKSWSEGFRVLRITGVGDLRREASSGIILGNLRELLGNQPTTTGRFLMT